MSEIATAYYPRVLDQRWTEQDAVQGSMTNTKLDLGSCVRATGLNVDGLRNHDGRMSTLTAIPVWCATWWLRLGGVVLLASALGAGTHVAPCAH